MPRRTLSPRSRLCRRRVAGQAEGPFRGLDVVHEQAKVDDVDIDVLDGVVRRVGDHKEFEVAVMIWNPHAQAIQTMDRKISSRNM